MLFSSGRLQRCRDSVGYFEHVTVCCSLRDDFTWHAALVLCFRVSVNAVLQPSHAVAGLSQDVTTQATAAEIVSVDSSAANSIPGTSHSQKLEHKLEVSCTLPTGEAVSSTPILSAASKAAEASPVADMSALAETNAAVGAASEHLLWESATPLVVDEALVRIMAASNAVMPLTLSYASRIPAVVDRSSPTPAASAVVAGKAAKPGKAAAAVVPEEVPWQAAQQHLIPFDLAPLLVGQIEVLLTLPRKGLPMPAPLQAFSSVTCKLQVMLHNPHCSCMGHGPDARHVYAICKIPGDWRSLKKEWISSSSSLYMFVRFINSILTIVSTCAYAQRHQIAAIHQARTVDVLPDSLRICITMLTCRRSAKLHQPHLSCHLQKSKQQQPKPKAILKQQLLLPLLLLKLH